MSALDDVTQDLIDQGILVPGQPYTVPNPATAPDPYIIDPVTGGPYLPPLLPPMPQSGATPPGLPPMGNLNSVGYMPYYVPPTGNAAPKPAAPAPKYPELKIETVAKAGRPDRYYVDALPDTILVANVHGPTMGLDGKGRLAMQFHNAKDVVYIPRQGEKLVFDRLYGVVEFRLRGDDDEEPDNEKKWGPSVPYDVKGPGYVHDD